MPPSSFTTYYYHCTDINMVLYTTRYCISLSPLRAKSTVSFRNKMRFSKLLEEETLPAYCALDFYPVRIGEIFKFKYRVLGKLGFGSSSTVWLCRDNA